MYKYLICLPLLLALSALSAQAVTFTIDDVYSITGRGTILVGAVNSGTLRTGDRMKHTTDRSRTERVYVVVSIEKFRQIVESATAPEIVGVILEGADKKDFKRGDQLSTAPAPTGPFCMKIDDSFSSTGIGTTVTGTIIAGTVGVGDRIELIGDGYERTATMVTRIQKSRTSVQSAVSGEAVGLTIRGIDLPRARRNRLAVAEGEYPVGNFLQVNATALTDVSLDDDVITIYGEWGAHRGLNARVILGTGLLRAGAGERLNVKMYLPVAAYCPVGANVSLRLNGRDFATGTVIANQ